MTTAVLINARNNLRRPSRSLGECRRSPTDRNTDSFRFLWNDNALLWHHKKHVSSL